jgi:hypothetical protein
MYPDEIKYLEEAFAYLNLITSTPPSNPPETLKHAHVDAIISVLERWPPSQRFPGTVLDDWSLRRATKLNYDQLSISVVC